MSHIRLYVDEDAMEGGVVIGLRSRGVDVLTARDASMLARSDEDCLTYATATDRSLYTFNIGDFHRIHGEWMQTGRLDAGLILCRQERFSSGEQIRRLLHLMTKLSAADMVGREEFLVNW